MVELRKQSAGDSANSRNDIIIIIIATADNERAQLYMMPQYYFPTKFVVCCTSLIRSRSVFGTHGVADYGGANEMNVCLPKELQDFVHSRTEMKK